MNSANLRQMVSPDRATSSPPSQRLQRLPPWKEWTGLAVALAACFAVSGIAGLATSSSVGSWYLTIERPAWNPPGWVFGPVWFTLYSLMAVAVWDVWRSQKQTRRALTVFAVQLLLNLVWSLVFFGLKSPLLALIEITLLLIAIVATIREFSRIRQRAAALLLPYLLWTSFATVLNAAIWTLNR